MLQEGIVLTMNPPDTLLTEIRTPQSKIEVGAALSVSSAQPGGSVKTQTKNSKSILSQNQNLLVAPTRSSAVIVNHNSATNRTDVFSLTNSGIRVSGLQGGNSVVLQGGETVSVTNGVLGAVQPFNLLRFYQTSQIARGLGPGQDDYISREPIEVQKTIRKVRVETLSALEDQRRPNTGGVETSPGPTVPPVPVPRGGGG